MIDFYVIALGVINQRELTDEVLSEVVQALKTLGASKEVMLQVRKDIETNFNVKHIKGEGLTNLEQDPWLDDYKTKLNWINWDAYKSYLASENFARETIRAIDEDTDEVLNNCGNPFLVNDWKIRGLVMGDVQSGKTANYAALINKAVDAGYQMIILLTGTIEDLRSQTQERIDETFVGRKSDLVVANQVENTVTGVGKYKSTNILCLTSVSSDFKLKNAQVLDGVPLASIKDPVLLVMKKNKSILTNFSSFLKKNTDNSKQVPIKALILDDEADNASVNANLDNNPATINKLIRQILSSFKQSTYVAYTATPFANVFINHDDNDAEHNDLFPSNFIYSLEQPDNYVGIDSLFGIKKRYTNHIEYIEDADLVFPSPHDKTLLIDKLPNSLHEALDVFMLSCAVRDLRDEKLKHRSMLVNVTRFTDVQGHVAKILKSVFEDRKEFIKQYLSDEDNWLKGGKPVNDIYDSWEKHFSNIELSWDEVRKQLYDSIASIKIIKINQNSKEKLNYKQYKTGKGRRVIAVGGLTLSRGLTLEGLAVSYFYRNAQAADTLLQMGRWFGYRKGYDDIFKIWLDPEVERTFEKLSDMLNEFRSELRTMHFNRQKPKDFGIKIKDHPENILITARNKMRNSKSFEFALSFSSKLVETPYLSSKQEINNNNLSIFKRFIENDFTFETYGSYFIKKNIGKSEIAELLSLFVFPEKNIEFYKPDANLGVPLIQFIRENDIPELQKWTLSIPNGQSSHLEDIGIKLSDGNFVCVKLRQRQFENRSTTELIEVNRRRVGNTNDEMVGIPDEQIKNFKDRKNDPVYKLTSGDYRFIRGYPVLTISLIEPIEASSSDKINTRKMLSKEQIPVQLVFAISLSFPKYEDLEARKVTYRFNTVSLQKMGLLEEINDEDD